MSAYEQLASEWLTAHWTYAGGGEPSEGLGSLAALLSQVAAEALRPLEWSKEVPTVPGDYYVGTTKSRPPYSGLIGIVDINDTRLLAQYVGSEGETYISRQDIRTWLWAGPLSPPLPLPAEPQEGGGA